MNYTDHQTSTVAQRLSELYVNYKNNYIEQCPDGSYRSYIEKGTFLGVGFLEHHLEGKRTFGIREEIASKVAIFDIDEDNRDAVKAIITILTELGITENSIHLSFSGKKGWHVACYFDKPVELNQLNLFQACVMVILEERYPDMVSLKIDLRPTPAYGVKLPLGIHQVTGNRCWFCRKDSFNPIERFEYIFDIEQFPRSMFNNSVMKKLTWENNTNRLVQRAMKYSLSYGLLLSRKNNDCETVDDILSEEILFPSSRHVTLFGMCIRLKVAGVRQLECEQMLCDWMERQDTDNYDTSLYKCMMDIEEIVSYIYEGHARRKRKKKRKNKSLNLRKTMEEYNGKLCLSDKEVKFILSFSSSKMWPVILFIMKYHKLGLSYSTQWKAHAISTIIRECSDSGSNILQAKTVRGYLIQLSDIGFIKINKAKLAEGENPESETGKNNVPQNYYYCLFGNCPTEIAVQPEFAGKMVGDDKVCIVETQNKSFHEILLDAVNFFGMREELFESMSRRSFKNLFGNNKRVA